MRRGLRRRAFLKLIAVGPAAIATSSWAFERSARHLETVPRARIDPMASPYGRWCRRAGVPAFAYSLDHESYPGAEWDPTIGPPTRRNWLMVGNRAIRLQAANDGTVAVFDETHGLRWLTAPDPSGTGISIVEDGERLWGTDYSMRAGEEIPLRTFGPTWLEVRDSYRGLHLERFVLCPEGEVPWLLVRVRLTLSPNADVRAIRHVERWALRPRFLNLLETQDERRTRAALAVSHEVSESAAGLLAEERFAPIGPGPAGQAARFLFGPPAALVLERLGDTDGGAEHRLDGLPHPTLEILTDLELGPGETRELWFRFGHADAGPAVDPARLLDDSLDALAARVPRAAARRAPEASREIPWHGAILTGALAVDRVIGGHSLDQASTYSYLFGFNGAARDPLQHALPLVYFEPDLALSVLRNTCAWAKPDGDLPYALDGAKRATNLVFRPSDQNLWALWLAAEYAAATGDLAAFGDPLDYHPTYGAAAVALIEHLRRQFRFFVDFVGRGERGHVRILNADWNDLAIAESGVDPVVMIAEGSSVLNSAMASWVFGVFAGLAQRLGEADLAAEARAEADDLRALVAEAWNGRWFHRAYAPGVAPIGDADCWLEAQPWAILCGAAGEARARSLLANIDAGHRAGSPLGARVRSPAPPDRVKAGTWGDATSGGIWYSINMTLVWAAARYAPDLAWDEWRRMTLAAHADAYPDVWEGTLSGPDAWNAPESTRPGRTWATGPLLAMQAFPVNNTHSHAAPLFAYLRLLGIEPTERGTLATGQGAAFRSRSFQLRRSGHGRLTAKGPVVVESACGVVEGGKGVMRW